MAFPIHQVPSWKFTSGHPSPLIAIVHHRMVGTLSSTDRTFTKGERVASTNFGIGLCSKHGGTDRVCIHQYVLLGHQAWGNGNNRFPDGHAKEGQPVPSGWNARYPQRLVNSRTISIEHQDNGMKGHPKRGVVPEEVIEASIWLDTLLLSGDLEAMQTAGIRFANGLARTMARELKALKPGPDTIVDHHYIAGPLKPSCWQPWRKDRVGFPKDRYLQALGGAGVASTTPRATPPATTPDSRRAPTPHPTPEERPVRAPGSTEEVMKSFATPTVPTLAKVRSDAWLYDNSALEPSAKNIHVDPGREMPLLGTIGTRARIVSYVDAQGVLAGRAYWVDAADIESTRPA